MRSIDATIRDAFRRSWAQRDQSIIRDWSSPELIAMTASLASLHADATVSDQQVLNAIAPLLALRRN